LAVQAGANVQLSAAMRSPFAASTLQLAIGAAVLVVAAAVAGSLGAFGLIGDVRPAELVGGLGSAVYITAGIVLFPRLGAVVTVGFLIAGQMLASLLLSGSAGSACSATRPARPSSPARWPWSPVRP
jgi:transporter family-2 protein